jgi:hypothetical protein
MNETNADDFFWPGWFGERRTNARAPCSSTTRGSSTLGGVTGRALSDAIPPPMDDDGITSSVSRVYVPATANRSISEERSPNEGVGLTGIDGLRDAGGDAGDLPRAARFGVDGAVRAEDSRMVGTKEVVPLKTAARAFGPPASSASCRTRRSRLVSRTTAKANAHGAPHPHCRLSIHRTQ